MSHCDISDSIVDEATRKTRNRQVRVLVVAVILAYLGQMMINPIIAPLSRKEGLEIWQVGATIAVAGLAALLLGQRWGCRAMRVGRRRTLLLALGITVISMILLAVMVQLALAGIVKGPMLFILFFLFRGVGFGIGIAAMLPVAQGYIAAMTTDQASCLRGMARIGSAQSLALVGGAIVGGSLAIAQLPVPIMAIPIVLLIALGLVLFGVEKDSPAELTAKPKTLSFFDTRVRKYLVIGFIAFTVYGMVQLITGFVVVDSLHLDTKTAGPVTGLVLLVLGVLMIIAQKQIVPRLGWQPGKLVRVGGLVMLIGLLLAVFIGGVINLLSLVLVTAGMALVMPGYNAGATLAVAPEERGGLAGLLGAVSGVSFVIAPAIGSVGYEILPQLPFIIGSVLMAIVFLLTLLPKQDVE